MINKKQRCEMIILLKSLRNINTLIKTNVLMVLILMSFSFVYHMWVLVIFLFIQNVFPL